MAAEPHYIIGTEQQDKYLSDDFGEGGFRWQPSLGDAIHFSSYAAADQVLQRTGIGVIYSIYDSGLVQLAEKPPGEPLHTEQQPPEQQPEQPPGTPAPGD